METLLIGLGVNVLTRLSEKTKVSQTYLALGLSVLGGAIYYFATNYYNVQRESLVALSIGIYGTSQVVYNLAKKFGFIPSQKK